MIITEKNLFKLKYVLIMKYYLQYNNSFNRINFSIVANLCVMNRIHIYNFSKSHNRLENILI